MPFRLWKSALKDDESLIDEAIAATYDRMIPIDPVRAEHVMSLIIRRHADAKDALKDLLSQQAASCRNYNKPSSSPVKYFQGVERNGRLSLSK